MAKPKQWVFVGGYGSIIETFDFDPDASTLTSVAIAENVPEAPTFLALDERRKLLFAVSEKGGADNAQPGRAISYRIDPSSGKLSKLSEVAAGGSNAVFVVASRSGRTLLTASSSTAEGRVAVIPIAADGTLAEPTDSRVAGKNAHGLVQSPCGRFVWVVCRGDELVAQYRLDEDAGKLTPLNEPHAALPTKPSGPRHIAVHPTHRVVYVISDWSGEIVTYEYGDDGMLRAPKSVSIFPAGKAPHPVTGTMTAAELEVSLDGRFVYASTRTPACQSLAILRVGPTGQLTLIANEEGGGLVKGPRHFLLSRDNRFLLLANQDNDTLLAFEVDRSSGALSRLGGATPTKVKMPNAVAFGSFE